MTYGEMSEKYTLSTGKKLYAHCGIIGLGPELNQISEGWDGGFGGYVSEELTSAEKLEVALYMIQRWTKFAEQIVDNGK